MTSDGGHEADDEADEDVQSPGDDGATTDDDSERCQDCGHRRPLEISYTIEDLDTLDQRQRQLRQSQSSGGLEVSSDGRRCRSFLSPDDALRDLRKHASQGAEIRWELHSSRSDVGQATTSTATTCGCHRSQSTLTPRSHPQRGDLRKHHSAEKDKWSLKPESEHDLRKHLSDDCRMAGSSREPRWTEHLQVPELHANPRQRCTCAKRLGPVSLSPSPSDETPEDSRRPSLRASRSLSPEDLPLLQKRPSATDSRSLTPVPQSEQSQQARTPSPQPQTQPTNSKASKKDKARLSEERKAMRSKWAVKPHFSLPSEPKGHKLWSDKDPKSKSLKERPKYSVRRSLSPDPDPRQVYRLDNRLVRKLISPEVSLVDAKWAPYEGHSPLPNVGMRRRDTKKVVHEIQWQPYESPIHIGKSVNVAPPAPRRQESSEGPLAYSTLEKQVSIYGAEDPPKPGDEFSSVTPTHLPPPIATPQHGLSSGTDDDDEAFRMRMLNQVSAFPMYQGAWREETPPPSPPAPDLSTPVWAPKPPTPPPVRKQQSVRAVTPSPPPEKRSTFKLRSTSSKKKAAMRAKSQESTRQDKRRSTVKHSTRRGDPRIDDPDCQQQQQQQQQQNQRRRPQLLRSKALLLEAPTMEASKRSLSEEVRPKRRGTESSVKRGLYFRAKSEDAARYNPWLSGDEENDDYDGYDDLEAELREYVTTV